MREGEKTGTRNKKSAKREREKYKLKDGWKKIYIWIERMSVWRMSSTSLVSSWLLALLISTLDTFRVSTHAHILHTFNVIVVLWKSPRETSCFFYPLWQKKKKKKSLRRFTWGFSALFCRVGLSAWCLSDVEWRYNFSLSLFFSDMGWLVWSITLFICESFQKTFEMYDILYRFR